MQKAQEEGLARGVVEDGHIIEGHLQNVHILRKSCLHLTCVDPSFPSPLAFPLWPTATLIGFAPLEGTFQSTHLFEPPPSPEVSPLHGEDVQELPESAGVAAVATTQPGGGGGGVIAALVAREELNF